MHRCIGTPWPPRRGDALDLRGASRAERPAKHQVRRRKRVRIAEDPHRDVGARPRADALDAADSGLERPCLSARPQVKAVANDHRRQRAQRPRSQSDQACRPQSGLACPCKCQGRRRQQRETGPRSLDGVADETRDATGDRGCSCNADLLAHDRSPHDLERVKRARHAKAGSRLDEGSHARILAEPVLDVRRRRIEIELPSNRREHLRRDGRKGLR